MSTIEKALGSLGRKADIGAGKEKDAPAPDTVERAGAAMRGEAQEAHPAAATPRKPLVEIPFDELQDRGFLSPMVPRSSIAEEFRGIKRPLLKNIASGAVKSDNPNLVMVTSALQGDGKTFTSINLALSIAMEQDKTVLFVDADVLKATAGRLLGVPSHTPGLIDLLGKNDVEPQDVILRTNMPKLRVLPAGSPSEHATELLASDNMHQLMLELARRYPDRVIVFDSPPLLLTTEAGVLAGFMGQIVFVASSGVTAQGAVQRALEHIGPDKMVGVVLNRAPKRRFNLFGTDYGYYGYGYGYGHGYGQGERDVAPAAGPAK
jgi:exopolysaccharide/PEP-CTERM locus tyrosine autokinase